MMMRHDARRIGFTVDEEDGAGGLARVQFSDTHPCIYDSLIAYEAIPTSRHHVFWLPQYR